jgi:DNA polymerase-3 subunit delta
MPKPGPAKDPLEDLKSQGPKPIYAIDGEERLLVDEAVRLLKEHALPKNARDFNYDSFNGKDAKLIRIVEAAQMLPAFAPRRMVLVENADELDFDDAEVLLGYLENPSPTTVLVFVAGKENFDARTKVYKAFQRSGVTIRYARPKPREMPDVVRRRAKSLGIAIDDAAIRALIDAVGTDASGAFQALELLTLYVGPGEKRAIGVSDVAAVVSLTKEESIFALADAIGLADRATALRGLHAMLTVAREPALRVLAMIARHWRNLARARSLLDAGMPPKEIEAAVGIPPFLLDNLLSQARRKPAATFAAGLQAIADTDKALKGGALDYTRAMERLVLGLMAS